MVKKKNILSRLFFSKLFFILSTILILFLVWIFLKGYNENRATNQNLESLKKEIEDLEKDNQEFSRLIEYFNSSSFVEKEAREKLGLKKEDEKVIAVTENNNYNNEQDSEILEKNIGSKENIFLPKLWIDYFLKIEK
ncbi:MAG: septum formation initiator family protein [Patescibacteria group bacterium]|nr:septum formation initiator family protein [Patescibacteria group bacterium]